MTTDNDILLTIGIPTYAREHVLVQTITQVLRQIDPRRMELIVADQTLNHEQPVHARMEQWEREGRLEWLRLEKPSVTRAQNEILRRMRGQYLLLLDDDVLIPPGFFEQHLACYRDADISGVGGQVFHCHNWAAPPDFTEPERGTTPHYPLGTPSRLTDCFVGCVSSFRKSALMMIGGYDECFIGPANHWEDDLSRRLLRAGGRILYQPKAWVIHLRVPSGGCRIPGNRLWEEWTKSANLILFALRHCRGKELLAQLWQALRTGLLRRENVVHPRRWPMALVGGFRGLCYGWRHRNHIRSIFTQDQDRDWKRSVPAEADR
jgi:GT2 family glycosyltransferase